jgi:hypothetical protein
VFWLAQTRPRKPHGEGQRSAAQPRRSSAARGENIRGSSRRSLRWLLLLLLRLLAVAAHLEMPLLHAASRCML